MSSRVFILGGTGMLGSAVLSVLSDKGLSVTATTRNLDIVAPQLRKLFLPFDALSEDPSSLLSDLGEGDYVVNCIGIIKHHLRDDVATDRRMAIAINSLLPYRVAELAEQQGFRVIQIATDCVYSGQGGSYNEDAQHDAVDVYGQSKSLGEVPSARFLNVRCSIIGPEQKNGDSLLEWVLSHPSGSSFTGYLDHFWNGVTTDAFARVVAGIAQGGSVLSGTFHLVPHDSVNKDELSRLILDAYGRTDVVVVPTTTGAPVDRTLSTIHENVNRELWTAGGYDVPPSIESMVRTLASTTSTLTAGRFE